MSQVKKVVNKEKIVSAAKKVSLNPGSIAKGSSNHLKGFMEFIRTQGAIGLAIGLVLGGAVGTMVKSLIDNVVMPPLGFIMGSADGIKGLSVDLGKTADGTQSVLHYGIFLNDLINFAIIALVVYFFVMALKIDQWDKNKS